MLNGITHHVCAVDGGGTGCRAIIANGDGSVLARATGGPANYTTNPVQSVQNVLDTIGQAAGKLDDALDLKTLVTHVGLAGIMGGEDVSAMAASLPFHTCTVSDDRLTTANGALGSRDGAVLAIGTGSFVAARRAGAFSFWGGWGFTAGDQASGAWLGRAILVHTLLACEGLELRSDLIQDILARFDDAPANISTFAARATPSDFAEFAPTIVDAAASGDAVGRALLVCGADYLNAVLKQADIKDRDVICLTGGVGPHYQSYLAPEYRARIRPANGVALDGALQLARQTLAEMEKQA